MLLHDVRRVHRHIDQLQKYYPDEAQAADPVQDDLETGELELMQGTVPVLWIVPSLLEHRFQHLLSQQHGCPRCGLTRR